MVGVNNMEKITKRLNFNQLEEGMIVAKNVEQNGRILLKKDNPITKQMVEKLRSLYFVGVVEVYTNEIQKKKTEAETKKEQGPTVISQDLLNDKNVLQNKLAISEQNAKLLQDKLDKVQAGKTQPITTYYVTAPNVTEGAKVVQEKIKEKDPTLPPEVLAKSDRTVVTPITKNGSGNGLAIDKQKVDVYKIDLRKDHRIKAGVTVVDSNVYNTVGYEQGRVEVLAQLKGTSLKGGTVLYNVIEK